MTARDEYDRTLAPLVARGTWAFIASCHYSRDDKETLVFPVGGAKGFYAQFIKGRQVQGVEITLGKSVSGDEFMGGAQTAAIQMTIVKGLLKSRFQLVEPSRLADVFLSQPVTRICDRYRG